MGNKYGEKLWDGDEGSDHMYTPGAGVLKPRDGNNGQYQAGSQKNFLKMKSGKPMSERASRVAQVAREQNGEGYSKGAVLTEKTKEYRAGERKQPGRGGGGRRGNKNKKAGRNNGSRRPPRNSGPKIANHGGDGDALDSMYKQEYNQRRNQENVENSDHGDDQALANEYEVLKRQSADNKLLIKFYKNKQKRRGGGRNQTAPGGSSQYEQPNASQHSDDQRGGLVSAGGSNAPNYNMPNLQNNGFGQKNNRMSSNSFANGNDQNRGNIITERSSVRLHAPAGGHTSINLGGNDANFQQPSCNSPIRTDNRHNNRNSDSNHNGNQNFAHGGRNIAMAGGSVMSSNSFANGTDQNRGNIITERSSTKRMAPPGGHCQMGDMFG